jgi:hypothetical protein
MEVLHGHCSDADVRDDIKRIKIDILFAIFGAPNKKISISQIKEC